MFEWERLEQARNEGREEGKKEGIAKGITQSIIKTVKILKTLSLTDTIIIENICNEFSISKEEALRYLSSSNQ